jgi:hypothetical protein
VKGDGEATCFSNIEDTQIPLLQEWCHQLTFSSRQRSARAFFGHLKTFATSVETYVRGIGDVTEADRAALRNKWESSAANEEDGNDWNADGDPFAAILGGPRNNLYAMPTPKVDAYGELTGVAPSLAKVRSQMTCNVWHD